MTTANKVTILRILLVPLFVVMVLYYANTGDEIFRLGAILSFSIASISDGIDGYIARRYNQKSELGAILDPLADKLLLMSGTILLCLNNQPNLNRIPLYFVVTIISRDLIILIGTLVILYVCDKAVVRPRWWGKVATVLQMITLCWTLLKWNVHFIDPLALAAVMFTVISGIYYVYDGVQQLSASPASSATFKP